MEENRKYGLLIQPSIKLNRQYFKELCKLHGIYVLYRAPLQDKHYTTYAEIDNNCQNNSLKVLSAFHKHEVQEDFRSL